MKYMQIYAALYMLFPLPLQGSDDVVEAFWSKGNLSEFKYITFPIKTKTIKKCPDVLDISSYKVNYMRKSSDGVVFLGYAKGDVVGPIFRHVPRVPLFKEVSLLDDISLAILELGKTGTREKKTAGVCSWGFFSIKRKRVNFVYVTAYYRADGKITGIKYRSGGKALNSESE